VSKAAINDVQKALNVIRSTASEENADTQMAVLALMLSTSESIVNTARKMNSNSTKPKPRVQKVAKPQTNVVKQKTPASNETDDTERTRSNDDLSSKKPQSPLTPQQQREQ
jgi:hypothetical protein